MEKRMDIKIPNSGMADKKKQQSKLRALKWRKKIKEEGCKIAHIVTRPEYIDKIRAYAKKLNQGE